MGDYDNGEGLIDTHVKHEFTEILILSDGGAVASYRSRNERPGPDTGRERWQNVVSRYVSLGTCVAYAIDGSAGVAG